MEIESKVKQRSIRRLDGSCLRTQMMELRTSNVLRPLFVKSATPGFLYRFQQFINLRRGSGDFMRWMAPFQIAGQRLMQSRNECYITGLPQEEAAGSTTEGPFAESGVSQRLLATHAKSRPLHENLQALLFVSLADLTQDQRQLP